MPIILVIPDVVFSAVVGSIQATWDRAINGQYLPYNGYSIYYSSSGTIKVTLYVRVPRYLVEAAPSVGHMFNFAKSSPILCFILFHLFNPQMPVILGPHVQILATPLVTESNTRTCDTILMQSHLTRFFVLRGKKAIDSIYEYEPMGNMLGTILAVCCYLLGKMKTAGELSNRSAAYSSLFYSRRVGD